MLKKFNVKNFKNFESEICFDLTAGNYAFNDNVINNDTVNTAIIFGENSSGKSNLILAIFDLITNITDFNTSEFLYNEFLNLNTDEELVEFKYEFLIEGSKILYSYAKKSRNNIMYENLYIDDKVVAHIDRRESDIATYSFSSFTDKVKVSENIYLCKYIDNRLNTEAEGKDVIAYKKFVSFVKKMLCFRTLQENIYIGLKPHGSANVFEEIARLGKVKDFEKFLSDLDINYDLIELSKGSTKTVGAKFKRVESVEFSTIASSGTKNLSIFYYWLMQSNDVKLIAIDEFDAFYHHKLSQKIIRMLLERRNTQVILTSHNTTLIEHEIMRADCYYEIKNNEVNSFSNNTNKKIRQAHNLEKLYRAGEFSE